MWNIDDLDLPLEEEWTVTLCANCLKDLKDKIQRLSLTILVNTGINVK